MSNSARRDADDQDDGVERLDAPNQQVVRPDGSGPADEGDGGSEPDPEPVDEPAAPEPEVDPAGE